MATLCLFLHRDGTRVPASRISHANPQPDIQRIAIDSRAVERRAGRACITFVPIIVGHIISLHDKYAHFAAGTQATPVPLAHPTCSMDVEHGRDLHTARLEVQAE